MRVQKLVSNSPVERFDLRVLRRFAGLDEVEQHVAICCPTEHSMTAELAAIVASQSGRQAPRECDALKYANDVRASKRERGLDRQCLCRAIIDDVEQAVCPPLREARMHKVDRPTCISRQNGLVRVAADVANVALARPQNVKPKGTLDAAKRALSHGKAFSTNHGIVTTNEIVDKTPLSRRLRHGSATRN